MYKTIIIATDGSDTARKGLDHGIGLAKALGASVTVVTVTEGWAAVEMAAGGEWAAATPGLIEDYEESIAAKASAVLAEASSLAESHGVSVRTVQIKDQLPAPGIIAAAEDASADLIVMGSHGRRGLGRLILGSQANEVLTTSTIPVLVVR